MTSQFVSLNPFDRGEYLHFDLEPLFKFKIVAFQGKKIIMGNNNDFRMRDS